MRESTKGVIALLLGILVFSSIEVVSKVIETGMPPFRLAFLRFLIGGLVLLPAALKNRRDAAPLVARDYVTFAKLGLIGVTITIGLYHLAVARGPANVSAMIFSCNPVFVAIFAPFMLGEKMNAQKIIAILCCVMGIVWIAIHLDGRAGSTVLGIVLMFVTAVCFAFNTILLKRSVPRYGALMMTCATSILGSLFLVPISLALEGVGGWDCGWVGWLGVLYLAVVATGLGYWMYFYGLSHVEASLGSMTFFLKPFIAALLAWFVLGETLTAPVLVGGVTILIGIGITVVPQLLKSNRGR